MTGKGVKRKEGVKRERGGGVFERREDCCRGAERSIRGIGKGKGRVMLACHVTRHLPPIAAIGHP